MKELDWTLSCLFDAMGAMSSKYNDKPEIASRAYDKDRDGFVISGGAGVLVLECYEHAKASANIYAEITGYGATSDGHDMVAPSGEGGERSMKLALSNIKDRKITYINAHGTSTPAGDVVEVEAIRRIFGTENMPPISSTKSLSGHSLGAAGVHEAIYSILMMKSGFLSASKNVFNLDDSVKSNEILIKSRQNVEFDTVLSNSFGFGGTNATLAFSKFDRLMPITIENKCGLILGVANDRSVAWGISKVLSNSGAEIALSYQNENLLKRVGPLAESINAKICMLADVQNESSLIIFLKRLRISGGS